MRVAPPFHLLYSNHPHKLLICFDFGTSKVQVSYAVNAEDNDSPMLVRPQTMPLQRGNMSMIAEIAIAPDCRDSKHKAELLFGADASDFRLTRWLPIDYIFQNLKQSSVIMDCCDRAYTMKHEALRKTQQRHDAALKVVKSFDQVTVKFPRGTKEVFSRKASSLEGVSHIDTLDDVLGIMLRWALDHVKHQLRRRSGVTDADIDRLFANDQVQIGVAVPDVLPAAAVSRYHKLLVQNGFGENVEMLSEARSAAAGVAKRLLQQETSHIPVGLGHFRRAWIDVLDIGHGTSDMSTVRTAEHGAVLQFEFPVDSTGDATGGKAIEDKMLDLIGDLSQDNFFEFVPADNNFGRLDLDGFLEGFRPSIAERKCNFENAQREIVIKYDGPGQLKQSGGVGDVKIHDQAITVPSDMLKESYDAFLEPITQFSHSPAGVQGLLERHYSMVQRYGLGDSDRLLLLVGGPPIAEYTQECIRSALAGNPATKDINVAYFGQRDDACVADGGVLMLADKTLRKRRFHAQAVGCVVSNRVEGDRARKNDNEVEWFFLLGQRADVRTEFLQTYPYEIEVQQNPNKDNFAYPVDFEWSIVRTGDRAAGQKQYVNACLPKITSDHKVTLSFDRALCESIGWKARGRRAWVLSFEFGLRVTLRGNTIDLEFVVPVCGRFKDPAEFQGTVSFSSSLNTEISHLVEEDTWKDNDENGMFVKQDDEEGVNDDGLVTDDEMDLDYDPKL